MRVDLPLCTGVFLFGLGDRLVGVGLRTICRQLPEQQNILRTAHAHLRAVLALLRPAEAVCLIVLPDHISHDGNHAEVGKAVLHIVLNTLGMERLHGRHTVTCGVSEQDAVLDMAGKYPARFENPKQLRAQIVHLIEEPVRALIVTEVVIAGRVFVVIGKWDGGNDQVNAAFLHLGRLFDTVVVHGCPVVPLEFHAINSYASGHTDCSKPLRKAVFFNNGLQIRLHGLVLLPLFHQRSIDSIFRFGVDDVYDYLLTLEKSVYAVDGLNEVVELIVDPDEDGPVTMPLEVAALTAQALFRGEQAAAALGEVNNPPFPLVIVHRAVDVHGSGNLAQNLTALLFQIMPENEMGGRIAVYDLLCLGNSGLDRPAFLVGRILETGRLIDFHADLSIPVQSRAHCGRQNVGPNLQRRQIVACGVIAQVGGRGQHQRPRRNPEPEFFFLVRI